MDHLRKSETNTYLYERANTKDVALILKWIENTKNNRKTNSKVRIINYTKHFQCHQNNILERLFVNNLNFVITNN